MKLRRPISRWAVWLFAAALLLKASMPLLATRSADAQGKALVEVCTVYGMSMVAVAGGGGGTGAAAGSGNAPAPSDAAANHHLDHQCPLTALAVLAAAAPQPLAGPPPSLLRSTLAPVWSPQRLAWPDAAAVWAARRRHGPPTFS